MEKQFFFIIPAHFLPRLVFPHSDPISASSTKFRGKLFHFLMSLDIPLLLGVVIETWRTLTTGWESISLGNWQHQWQQQLTAVLPVWNVAHHRVRLDRVGHRESFLRKILMTQMELLSSFSLLIESLSTIRMKLCFNLLSWLFHCWVLLTTMSTYLITRMAARKTMKLKLFQKKFNRRRKGK